LPEKRTRAQGGKAGTDNDKSHGRDAYAKKTCVARLK
jgi:hypothetical protein